MADERIDIIIGDSIAEGVITKLERIADAASRGAAGLTELKAALKGFSSGSTAAATALKAVSGSAAEVGVAATSAAAGMAALSAASRTAAVSSKAAAATTTRSLSEMLGMQSKADKAAAALTARLELASLGLYKHADAFNTARTAAEAYATAIASKNMYMMGGAPPPPNYSAYGAVAAGPLGGGAPGGAAGVGAGGGAIRTSTGMWSPAGAASEYQRLGDVIHTTTGRAFTLGEVLRTMFLAYFAVAATQRILRVADGYAELGNKLKIVAQDGESVSSTMTKLYNIAQESRADLGSTVILYQRLSLAMRHLNKSSDDTAEVVKTVNLAMLAGGATAQEQTAAIRQLSQAFNKGKADGDEFRSMMENAPVLMDLIAEKMGIARHELLALAPQGKITAEIMYEAFSDSERAAEKLNGITTTLGHSLTQLGNSTTMLLGRVFETTGVLRIFSMIISGIATNIEITLPLIAALTAHLIGLRIAAVAAFAKVLLPVSVVLALAAATGKLALEIHALFTGNKYTMPEVFDFLKEKWWDINDAIQSATYNVAKFFGLAKQESNSVLTPENGFTNSTQRTEEFSMLAYTKGRDKYTASIEQARASTQALEIAQRMLKEAEEEGYTVTERFTRMIELFAAAEDRQITLHNALVGSIKDIEGPLQAVEVKQKALSMLWLDTGLPGYARALAEANAEYQEQHRLLNMTDAELAAYNATQDEAARIARIHQGVLEKTVYAERDLLTELAFIKTEMAKGGAAATLYAVVLKQVEAALAALRGETENTSAAAEMRELILNRTVRAEEELEAMIAMTSDMMKEAGNNTAVFATFLASLQNRLDSLRGVAKDTAEAVQSIFDQSYAQRYNMITDGVERLRGELAALDDLYAAGAIGAGYYAQQTAAVAADMWRLKIATGDAAGGMAALHLAFAQARAETPTLAEGLADTLTDAIDGVTDAVGEMAAAWALAEKDFDVRELFRAVVRDMIKELTALIVKTYALALARSVAGLGGAPGGYYGDGTMTQSQAAAAGYAGPGFASGGYTGNAPKNAVTGYVHGQEFVAHARATARNRAALEHMNATGDLPTPKVTINNNAPGVTVRAEYVGPDEVRLIAEEVVARSAPSVVAGSLGNPNSPMSKSLRSNTTADRRLR